jgi:DNA-binding HxlR family transcriptional regulator
VQSVTAAIKQPDPDQTLCPIARAAAVIADRWTILILRELRMKNDRFDGILAQTGMSSNLLTQRLKAMEHDGLIDRRLYSERPKRYAYGITGRGRELDGLMLTLRLWGMRHCGFDPNAETAVTMTHRRTGANIDAHWQPAAADLPFTFADVDTRINPRWAAERAARSEAFLAERRIRVAKRAKRVPAEPRSPIRAPRSRRAAARSRRGSPRQ